MAKYYDYIMAIWLRLESTTGATELLEELREYLEAEYQIIKIEVHEESERNIEEEIMFSLQLQLAFNESQMDGDNPTSKAVAEFDKELRHLLEARYQVNYLEVMDDALTSFLLAERE